MQNCVKFNLLLITWFDKNAMSDIHIKEIGAWERIGVFNKCWKMSTSKKWMIQNTKRDG